MDEAHEFLTGGYKLQIAGNKDSGGESFPTYYCKGRSSKGKCPKRATISASYLDSYSKSRCSQRFKMRTDFSPKPSTQSEQIENAQREGEAAEHELMLYLETDLVSTIGQAAFRQGVSARQGRLDEAREKFAALRAQAIVAEDVLTGDLLEARPQLSVPERRQLMHRAPRDGPSRALGRAESGRHSSRLQSERRLS